MIKKIYNLNILITEQDFLLASDISRYKCNNHI